MSETVAPRRAVKRKSPESKPGDWRGTLRILHRWIGLIACVPLGLQAASGCVLLVAENWLDHPPPAQHTGTPGPVHGIADIIAAAQDHKTPANPPAAPKPLALISPGAGRPMLVRFSDADLLVDPQTLAVEQRSSTLRLISNWHDRLLMLQTGSIAVGGFGIVLILLGISGVVLWWPSEGRWRQAFTAPSRAEYRRQDGYGAWYGWHLLLGAVTVVMAMIVALTGLCMAFGIPGTVLVKAPADDPALATTISAPLPLTLDDAVKLALTAMPGTRWRMVVPPRGAGQPIRVDVVGTMRSNAPLTQTLTIDAKTGRVLTLAHRATDGGTVALSRFIRSTHTGTGFGLAWQVVLFSYGLVLVAIASSGLAMRLTRPRRRRRTAHPDKTAAPRPPVDRQLSPHYRSSTDA